MTIYPTVLYIKQHSITGLKYFGKTTAKDPYKYLGSGVHWLRHIKKHGKEHVITLWISEPYTNSYDIAGVALAFSRENNIVESSDWANLIIENGLDGVVAGTPSPLRGRPNGRKGIPLSAEHRQKIYDAKKGIPGNRKGERHTNEARLKMSNARKGIKHDPHSAETIQKISDAKKGKPAWNKGIPSEQVICPHCGKIGGISNMKRYHFDNCNVILVGSLCLLEDLPL
jgi:hypothetical protein